MTNYACSRDKYLKFTPTLFKIFLKQIGHIKSLDGKIAWEKDIAAPLL